MYFFGGVGTPLAVVKKKTSCTFSKGILGREARRDFFCAGLYPPPSAKAKKSTEKTSDGSVPCQPREKKSTKKRERSSHPKKNFMYFFLEGARSTPLEVLKKKLHVLFLKGFWRKLHMGRVGIPTPK